MLDVRLPGNRPQASSIARGGAENSPWIPSTCSGSCSPLVGAPSPATHSCLAVFVNRQWAVPSRVHSLISVNNRYLNMAMASLGSAASSLVLFSRRVLRPELTALCSYHTKVVDHYENPRNVGTLDKNAKNVGTGLVGAPACGDVMKLQIQVDENGKIVDAKFKTFGCGSAIASSSLATEWVKGKSVDEALKIRNTDIAKELCLPPVKLHCSMLAEDAIKAALSDYRVKQDMEKK
uniref:iron-sulfur cluster assembly enzyme ISCU, mitochondrial n=1 Tax=Gasterosteus aculeatus aculeatus TaxID=481459 RepID=UPI001A99E06F|nr:iron-sulfur cluster assembly enzyme ISCU, mitochondrial [Gasterosteus aculeatus aculeatus]